ncbi:MAG: hypothetical protein ACR2N3_11370 [Pyrinomonadaceae bacterium]
MLKKTLSILLVALLINLAVMPSVFANNNPEKDAKFAAKVKAEIAKLGVGEDSKVEVKLKDGTKLKGYVSEITDSGFVITDKAGESTSVPYPNAKQVKGGNSKAGIIILVGILAFFTIVIIIAATKHPPRDSQPSTIRHF